MSLFNLNLASLIVSIIINTTRVQTQLTGVRSRLLLTASSVYLVINAFRALENLVTNVITAMADIEQGFANIQKTAEFSAQELEKFKQDFLDMAIAIKGVSLEDLFKIGEIGGQMGIAKENLADYIQAVAMTSAATGEAADKIAKDLGAIINITQSAEGEMLGLGAAVNFFENKSIAAASDITEVAKRIAAAGHSIGLTKNEIIALSAAVGETGLRNENLGTAMQSVINRIVKYRKEFAELLNMNEKGFTSFTQKNPAEAIVQIFEKLGTLNQSEVLNFFESIGLSGERITSNLRGIREVTGQMRDFLKMSKDANGMIDALFKEFGIQTDTINASIIDLKKNWTLLMGAIGDTEATEDLISNLARAEAVLAQMLSTWNKINEEQEKAGQSSFWQRLSEAMIFGGGPTGSAINSFLDFMGFYGVKESQELNQRLQQELAKAKAKVAEEEAAANRKPQELGDFEGKEAKKKGREFHRSISDPIQNWRRLQEAAMNKSDEAYEKQMLNLGKDNNKLQEDALNQLEEIAKNTRNPRPAVTV